jgi:hypothetical protein
MGVSVFIADQFARKLKIPPFFWLGPCLIDDALGNHSSLLSDKEVRTANSSDGLNVAVWEAFVQPEFHRRAEVQNYLLAAFIAEHRGYLLKEAFIQASSHEQFRISLDFGGLLVSPDGTRLERSPGGSVDQVFTKPHLFAVPRDIAIQRMGNWIGCLFVRPSPLLGMRRSEQRLLIAALRGGTDEELGMELGLSTSAVKKTWRLIYERVRTSGARILPPVQEERENGDRGREKKQRVLAYVREHPEELRPVNLKQLKPSVGGTIVQTQAPRRASRRNSY